MKDKFNRHQNQTEFIYNYKNGTLKDFIKGVPKNLYFGASSVCKQACLFCHSKDFRHKGQHLPFDQYLTVLRSFKELDLNYNVCVLAGGGEPLLYKSGKYDINDQIIAANDMGYKVFIISAENDYTRISKEAASKVECLRISFTRINQKFNKQEGTDYNFGYICTDKIIGSYIMYDERLKKYSDKIDTTQRIKGRTNIVYEPFLTSEMVDLIIDIHKKYPFLNNTRISPDYFLSVDDAKKLSKKFINRVRAKEFDLSKFNIDTSHERDSRFEPYKYSCIEGIINPTIHSKYPMNHPEDDGSFIVSWCRQHVFSENTFSANYFMCNIDEIKTVLKQKIDTFIETGTPQNKNIPGICTMCCASKMMKAAHNVYKLLK